MGFFQRFEKKLQTGLRNVVEESRRKRAEKKAFKKILSKKLETARRQVYAREMEKQVREKVKRDVELKFYPQKRKKLKPFNLNDITAGMPK